MKVLIYSADNGAFPEVELYEGLRHSLGDTNVVLHKPKVYGTKGNRTLPTGAMADGEIRERIDEFDCILFFYCTFADKDFEYVLNRRTSAVKMYVDGVDDFFVRRVYHNPEVRYYLKRELYKHAPSFPYTIAWGTRYLYETAHIHPQINYKWIFTKWAALSGIAISGRYKKMRPLPMTVIPRDVKSTEKKVYDLSFMGHINSIDRLAYANAAQRIAVELGLKAYISKDYLNPRPALGRDAYLKVLQSSKAGLSTRGIGYDTYRYWEIPCYGTALLSQRTPQVIPNNFVDGDSAMYFSGKEELNQKVKRYIAKSDEWREIARNGQRQFFRYHTPEKRAEYILKLVKE